MSKDISRDIAKFMLVLIAGFLIGALLAENKYKFRTIELQKQLDSLIIEKETLKG